MAPDELDPRAGVVGIFTLFGQESLPVPFGLAMDVAHTSSWCDYLVEELNEARAKFGPRSHLKIDWLETTLLRLVRVAFPLMTVGPP